MTGMSLAGRLLHRRLGVRDMMWIALAALAPGALAAAWAWTPAALVQAASAAAAAMLAERAMLALRGNPPGESSLDGSAALAGAIVGLSVPPLAPLWVGASAAVFGICIAKHCFGGLGANAFNPAMAGYAFAYVSFPFEFGAWPAHGEAVPWEYALRAMAGGEIPDAVAAPTALQDPDARFLGLVPAGLFALGGLALVLARIADWRLAAPYLAGVVAAALLLGEGGWPAAGEHLLAGGTAMAAFFVMTDPGSAPARPGCRVAVALAAGALTVTIREWGSHPDGIAFAVLAANAIGPALDRAADEIAARRRRGHARR